MDFPTHTILNERGPQRLNQFSIVNIANAVWKNEREIKNGRRGGGELWLIALKCPRK